MSDHKIISSETNDELVLARETPEQILNDDIDLLTKVQNEQAIELEGDKPLVSDETLPEQTIDMERAKLILEAAILSASEPLQLPDLRKLFHQELSSDMIRRLLDELKSDWSSRAVELTPVASGWRFRVKPEYSQFVHRMNPEKPPRYSRAVMETLAIIAYRQPATRGDVAQIRGVDVSSQIIKTLEEREWIETVGHREVPGRPALYATTKKFLDDLNLRSLEELPPLDELQMTLNITTTDNEPVTQSPNDEVKAVADQEDSETIVREGSSSEIDPVDQIEDSISNAAKETHSIPSATK
jgi:segregation and condensation protein B